MYPVVLRWGAVVSLAGALAGCGVQTNVRARDGRVVAGRAHGSAGAAVARASNEIPCPARDLLVESIGSGGYHVTGCGVRMTYSCMGSVCVPDSREGAGGRAGREVAAESGRGGATWSDQQVRQLQVSIYQGVVACLPEDIDSVQLQLAISPQGQVRRVGRSVLARDANACLDHLLSRGRMGGSVASARFVLLSFRRNAQIGSQPIEAGSPDSEASAPMVVQSAEAAARAAVDTRAAAILACVSDEALALQVSWTREGRLDALLRGERQGTPEEACVRAIVQRLSIEPPGAPGTIVHAVQR